MPNKVKNEIKGVEIFSAGKWNGDKYTIEDIDDIIKSYNETKDILKPCLKLGHNGEQRLLRNDGMPAAGWVSKLYRNGKKLVADFVDIPKEIYKLIQNKAYTRVSSEICRNLDIGDGKVFKKMLTAVALLGSDLPAVSNLKEILSLYSCVEGFEALKCYSDNNHDIKSYTYISEGEKMPNKTIEQVLEENKILTEKIKGLEESNKEYSSLQARIVDLETSNKEYKKVIAEQAMDKIRIENEKFISDLEKEDLIPESMKVYVNELVSDKKEYSIDDKKLSKKEIIKSILSLSKKCFSVNLDESSEKGDSNLDLNKDELLDKKIKEYANENKISYSKAYSLVMKQEQNK